MNTEDYLYNRAERMKPLITVVGAKTSVLDAGTLYIECSYQLLEQCKRAVSHAAAIKHVYAESLGWDGKGFTVLLRSGQ